MSLLVMLGTQVSAQFSLKGEFRPRFEYRGGYGEMLSLDEEPVLTVSQRSRVSAYYQSGIFSSGFAIQDVRVWGDDNMYSSTGVSGSTASIDLNEAWIGIRPYSQGLIKIGRQYWIYEDERILSSRGWNQNEVKYDAVLYQHDGERFKLDAGFSWNNLQDKTFGNEYTPAKLKTLNFIYLKQKLTDWITISATGIVSGFTATDTTPDINLQGTYGLYFVIKKGNLNAMASGYYQNGRNRAGLSTSAFLLAANGEYRFAENFLVGAGIDYISGTDQTKTDPGYMDKNHSFDLLYGIRHRFYGHLDYFTNMPKGTANAGLADILLRFRYYVTSKAHLGVDFHNFSLQGRIYDKTVEGSTALPRQLGQEADLYFSYDPVKIIRVTGGYSLFFATETMEKIQGVYGNARFPTWIWIMVTAKPVFFETAAK